MDVTRIQETISRDAAELRAWQEGRAVSAVEDCVRLPLEAIRVDRVNARRVESGVDDLADSIAACGLLHPLTVQIIPKNGEQYRLLTGFRRYRALVQISRRSPDAFADGVPVRLWEGTETEAELVHLAENTSRKNLRPWETGARAIAIQDRDPKITTDAIASALGITAQWLRLCMRAQRNLSEEVKAHVDSAKVKYPSKFLLELIPLAADEQMEAIRQWHADANDRKPRGPRQARNRARAERQIRRTLDRIQDWPESPRRTGVIQALRYVLRETDKIPIY